MENPFYSAVMLMLMWQNGAGDDGDGDGTGAGDDAEHEAGDDVGDDVEHEAIGLAGQASGYLVSVHFEYAWH